jgi:signal transduction histidine kinase/DNA-binding response OmpR family regulator
MARPWQRAVMRDEEMTGTMSVHAGDPAPPPVEVTDILVVDDLVENLLVYRTVLESPDLNIIAVRSGQEALREVLAREFAVILLDVNMPEMDGFEMATLIRRRKRSATTPVIFLTAFKDDERMAQAYASGAVDFISTPVVPEILRAKVGVFVELFRMRRQSAAQAEERAKRASAEEAARRSAFLAEAGAALTRSSGLDALRKTLAHTPLPFLADICVLYSTGLNDRPVGFHTAWTTPDAFRAAPSVRTMADCPVPWLALLLKQAIQEDEPQVLDVLQRSGADGTGLPETEGGQGILLPIRTRQGTLGALALLRVAGSARYGPDEVNLAQEFGTRAAIALENVMLIHSIQEADRRKDEFLGMLAHELRNPLAPLRNAVTIMDMVEEKDDIIEQARAVIDRQVTHMTRLVDDLLDATRIARGKVLLRKEPCDLRSIVRQTAADYRSILEGDRLNFIVDIGEEPLLVLGDPTRLAQVVGNLLHNAHKFTEAGGSVTLKVRSCEQEGWAELTVQDTGIGIESVILPHVFDVFRQADQGLERSRGGLGLGLALVKGLMELHGGTVRADSAGIGQGTSFIMRLPVLSGVVPVAVRAEPFAQSAPRHNILVIDDNVDAAESIGLLLRREGHQVSTAYTGLSGLETAMAHTPEVVICDIGLPGMDGYQIARSLRESGPGGSMYLIALTGYGREEDQAKARDAGFSRHMTKPIDFKELRKVLAELKEVS